MKFTKLFLMAATMVFAFDTMANQNFQSARRSGSFANLKNATNNEIIVMVPLTNIGKKFDPSVHVRLGDTSLADLMDTVKKALKASISRNPLLEKAIKESKIDLANLQLWDWNTFTDHPSSIESITPGSQWYAADQKTRDRFIHGNF